MNGEEKAIILQSLTEDIDHLKYLIEHIEAEIKASKYGDWQEVWENHKHVLENVSSLLDEARLTVRDLVKKVDDATGATARHNDEYMCATKAHAKHLAERLPDNGLGKMSLLAFAEEE